MTRLRLTTILVGVIASISLAATAAGPLSGLWRADLTIAPEQTTPFTAFYNRLDVTLDVGVASLTTRSDFKVDGWVWQSFRAAVGVPSFGAESNLLFWADPWTFCYADGSVMIELDPLYARFAGAFISSNYSGDVQRGAIFELGSRFPPVTIRSITHFGAGDDGILFISDTVSEDCEPGDIIAPSPLERFYTLRPTQTDCFTFTEQEFIIEAALWGCMEFESRTTISLAGFESQIFSLDIHPIAPVPFMLDLDFTYTVDTKSISFAPSLGLGTALCGAHVLSELLTMPGGTAITGLSIYGMDLYFQCETFGFRSLSLFDGATYSLYERPGLSMMDSVWISEAGYAGMCGSAGVELPDYWEVIELWVAQGSAYGNQMRFLMLTFFDDTTALFDWVKTEFRAEIGVLPTLTLKTTVTLRDVGFSDWAVGIDLRW